MGTTCCESCVRRRQPRRQPSDPPQSSRFGFWWRLFPLTGNLRRTVVLRLPPRCWWDLRCSGILRNVEWSFCTDVSGQLLGTIFKGQEVYTAWRKKRIITRRCAVSRKGVDLTKCLLKPQRLQNSVFRMIWDFPKAPIDPWFACGWQTSVRVFLCHRIVEEPSGSYKKIKRMDLLEIVDKRIRTLEI
jgi:hypothetical protein